MPTRQDVSNAIAGYAPMFVQEIAENLVATLGLTRAKVTAVSRGEPRKYVHEVHDALSALLDTAFPNEVENTVQRPVCDECDEEMHPHTTPDGREGWSCDTCGWSYEPDNDRTDGF